MLKISSKMKKILTAIISLIALVGIGIATNMVVTNNNIQLNSKAHKAPSIEERRAINGTVNVTFDAYFLNNSERTNEALLGPIIGPVISNIPNKEMYMELSVLGDGELRNGTIKFATTNSVVTTTLVSDNVINGSYIGKATDLNLKTVTSGTTRIIKALVHPNVEDKDYFVRNDNKVIFKGTYVSADGTETLLEKEVNFSIETMYENLNVSSKELLENQVQTYYYKTNYRPEAKFIIINSAEQFEGTRKDLINFGNFNDTFKEFEYRVKIPKFNGYNAEEVDVNLQNYSNGINIEKQYDKNTGELVIKYSGFFKNNPTNIIVQYPVEAGKNKEGEELTLKGELRATAYNSPKYKKNLEATILAYCHQRRIMLLIYMMVATQL